MQAIGRQPQRAPYGAPVHYERHRPEQTTLYRLVQQHAATFFAQAETEAGADMPQFVKDEFDAFLKCGILANGFSLHAAVRCRADDRQALEQLCRYIVTSPARCWPMNACKPMLLGKSC